MAQKQSFVTTRSQLISLESNIETLLASYSTFAQTTSSDATGKETKLDGQIEKALFRSQEVIDSLASIVNASPSISASKLSQFERHKETLANNWKSFRNIRSSIQQERNRLNLLFSVKNDIAQQQLSMNADHGDIDEESAMQSEFRKAEHSNNIMDRLISQAWETRNNFSEQSSVLGNANNKILQTLQRFPGLNATIGNIRSRRKKNAIILACVITICIVLLFFSM